MNTGIQRSGTTPFGSWTNTTQIGEHERGKGVDAKNVPLLISQHDTAYTATASLGYMQDFVNKVLKAKEAVKEGFAYIHVLTPCTTGWLYAPEKGIEISKVAVKTNYFPLWEAEYGKYRLTHVEKERKPISEYTKLMKRFAHMTEEELSILQNYVDKKYQKIENLID
jgi:pyruvate/2-oxoacid:ferredoxin oxidoreductase beta subunit